MPTIYYDSHGIGTCEKNIDEFIDFNKMINDILSSKKEIAFVMEISSTVPTFYNIMDVCYL